MSEDEAMRRLRPYLPNGHNFSTFSGAARSLMNDNLKMAKAKKGEEEEPLLCPDTFTGELIQIPKSIGMGISFVSHQIVWKLQHAMEICLDRGHPWLVASEYAPAWKPGRIKESEEGTVCAGATGPCIYTCLLYTGHNEHGYDLQGAALADAEKYYYKFGMKSSEEVMKRMKDVRFPIASNMIRKMRLTEAFLMEPEAFVRLWRASILHHRDLALSKGYDYYVRPNVFSDIPWEIIYPELFHFAGPETTFYDYTKVPLRNPIRQLEGPQSSLYDLTFSFGGGAASRARTRREMQRGLRAAYVFYFGTTNPRQHSKQGLTLDGFPVIDGDCHDLRSRDPYPAVVGLRYKQPPNREHRMTPWDEKTGGNLFLVPVSLISPGVYAMATTPRLLDGFSFVPDDLS
jgi:hypothetical protein